MFDRFIKHYLREKFGRFTSQHFDLFLYNKEFMKKEIKNEWKILALHCLTVFTLNTKILKTTINKDWIISTNSSFLTPLVHHLWC